jgi:hypothetical protein
VQIENPAMWSVNNKDGFDILTKRNADGKLAKKIYLSGSEYRVARIEYFDAKCIWSQSAFGAKRTALA